jgi:general secretion pathway protein I
VQQWGNHPFGKQSQTHLRRKNRLRYRLGTRGNVLKSDCRTEGPVSNGHTGFALIEILVAVSILAISLVVILQLFSGGLKSRKLSEQYARGVFYAREKMAETLLVPDLSEGETRGETEDAYQWQINITQIIPEEDKENAEDLPVDLLKIDVSGLRGERAKRINPSPLRR